MAIEILYPNGDDSGWLGSGTYLDIDEGTDSPNDADYMATAADGEGESVIIDLTDSVIIDADTVNTVTVKVRALSILDSGNETLNVTLRISGGNIALVPTGTLTGVYQTFALVDATNWDVDWTAAEVDSMQVQLTTVQGGKPTAAEFRCSALQVEIDYTPDVTGLSLVEVLDEVENSNETKNTSTALNRLLAETLNAKESPAFGVVTSLILNKILNEVEQSNENNIPVRARNQIINEVLNLSENILEVVATLIVEIISEAVNSNEIINTSLLINRLISEISNVNEIISRSLSEVRILSEEENMNENTLATKIIVELINEILNPQETIIETKSIVNVLSEIINLPETTIESLATIIVEIISETVNFNETKIEVLAALIIEIINETLNHPETIINSSILVREIVEVVQDSETIDQAMVRIRIIFETQNVVENNSLARGITQVVNEVLDFVENIFETTIAPIIGVLSAMIRLLPTMTGKGSIDTAITGKNSIKSTIKGKAGVRPKNG